MTNAKYEKLTVGLIGAWLLLALSGSALQLFENDSARPPVALGVAVLTPILLFSAWYAASADFRRFVLALNPRALTMVQTWRLGAFVFLVLHAHGILPAIFALPAGWGDIVIGATAPLVAMKLTQSDHRTGFILWQVLGMLDLVTAVSLGALAGPISPEGITTAAMAVLPLSLIPTFAVPLFFILHIACIAQAFRWPAQKRPRVGERLASSGV